MVKEQKAKVFSPPRRPKRRGLWFFLKIFFPILLLVVGIFSAFFYYNQRKEFFNSLPGKLESLISLKKPLEMEEGFSFKERVYQQIDKKVLNISETGEETEDYLVIISSPGLEIYLSKNKDLGEQTRTLQSVLSKAKIENREIILIDFRFEKLIVRYK